MEPVIGSNDKTLLTDGHIDVHSSQPHSKANFQGRVSVQVKGRSLRGAKRPPHAIRITKTDLAGYLKNQGVLYFVVFLDPETARRMPTGALLNPLKIRYLIKKMGGQKSIGVDLKPFPSDPSRIEGIAKLALQSADENPSMRIDLKQLKDLTRITRLFAFRGEYRPAEMNSCHRSGGTSKQDT